MIKVADLTTPLRAALITKSYKNWVRPDKKVLDIGCGTGVITDEIARKFKVKVVGCDIDNYLIRKIPFKKMGSLLYLPFKSGEFDTAMLNDVLHHTTFDNQLKLLKESLRVAEACLVFELRPTFAGKIFDYIINKIHNPRMAIPFAYRSEKEWVTLFRKNKIKFENKRVVSSFFYPSAHVAYRLTK